MAKFTNLKLEKIVLREHCKKDPDDYSIYTDIMELVWETLELIRIAISRLGGGYLDLHGLFDNVRHTSIGVFELAKKQRGGGN